MPHRTDRRLALITSVGISEAGRTLAAKVGLRPLDLDASLVGLTVNAESRLLTSSTATRSRGQHPVCLWLKRLITENFQFPIMRRHRA